MDIELQCHFDQMGTYFLLVKSWLLLFMFQIFGMKDYSRRFEYHQSTLATLVLRHSQGHIKGLQPVQIKLSFHFNSRFLKFTRVTVSNYYTN